MKLLCDEMLLGLARWLRAAGYDTETAEAGEEDAALLARAVAEGRRLITRDRKMMERRDAEAVVVVLECDGTEGGASELSRRLGIDWLLRPFSRCLVCNTPLEEAPARLRGRVPAEFVHSRLLHCNRCDKVYWEGGHVHRMRERLARWAAR